MLSGRDGIASRLYRAGVRFSRLAGGVAEGQEAVDGGGGGGVGYGREQGEGVGHGFLAEGGVAEEVGGGHEVGFEAAAGFGAGNLGGAEAVEEVAEGGGGGEGDGAGGVVLGDGFVEAFGKGVEAVVDVLVPFGESQHFDVSRLDLVGNGEQLVGYVHGNASAVAPLLRYEYAFKSLEGASYYAYIVAFLKVDFPG